jgi:hypothetical protein
MNPMDGLADDALLDDDDLKRRRWTKREDEKLRAGVRALGTDDWARICSRYLSGHGRAPDQCRHRWEHVLREGLVKGAFTPDEDAIILEMLSNGQRPSWMDVAARIPGRIGKQCRERWTNHLDPNLKKGGWTPEEDAVMAAAQARWGNAWTKIAELLPGRAENAVKNRWNSAFRRNNAHAFGRATDDRVARALQEARRGMEIIDRAGSLHADGGRSSPANISAPPRRRAHRRARSPAQLAVPRARRAPSPLSTGAPPEGLDLVVLAIESSRGPPALHDEPASPLPESPRKKRKEPLPAEQASSSVDPLAGMLTSAGVLARYPLLKGDQLEHLARERVGDVFVYAEAAVKAFVETLRERSPSDDQAAPSSVITPPPQPSKSAWPEARPEPQALDPSPDNSVAGAATPPNQPVSPV